MAKEPKEPKDLKEALKAIAELETVIEEKDATIADLTKAVEALEEKKTVKLPTVKHEGKTYKVLVEKFHLKVKDELKTFTAEDVVKSKELIAHLVDIEASVLAEVK